MECICVLNAGMYSLARPLPIILIIKTRVSGWSWISHLRQMNKYTANLLKYVSFLIATGAVSQLKKGYSIQLSIIVCRYLDKTDISEMSSTV